MGLEMFSGGKKKNINKLGGGGGGEGGGGQLISVQELCVQKILTHDV